MAAPMAENTGHEQWSSRIGFLMAAVGSSVGLGNLWRFSAEAGQNGGGAFVLVYLLCVVFIGIPVLMSEYIIGRGSSKASAVQSVQDLAGQSGVSKNWSLLAWIGMLAAFMVVCFYSSVAGWVLAYIPKFLLGAFKGQDPKQIASQFGALIGNPKVVLPYFTAFVILTTWLVSRGVNRGIEWASKFLMPIFFILLAGLAIYSLVSGFGTQVEIDGKTVNASGYALTWLFRPDFSQINLSVATRALGQAFFSIGIGSAIMITYGSYLKHGVNIPKSAAIVALTDTGVALIAGMAIFPIVFAHGLSATSGAGLFFETLPIALVNAPGGLYIGTAFFVLAIFAAVTSSISLLEVSAAFVIDKTGWSRPKSAWLLGVLMWVIGSGTVFSQKFFGFLDSTAGTIMLPVSGMMVVLFVGWRLNKAVLAKELEGTPAITIFLLMFLVRFVALIAVGVILVSGIFEKYFGISLFG
jgi:neurotransmitter:Na+ symporter, NSS family